VTDVSDRLRAFWDADAGTYDHSASHALSDPVEAACWRAALARHLPPPPAAVLDMGAGTGSMSVLMAEMGYRVTAADLSPEMLERAKEKARARGISLAVHLGPATEPPDGPFDAVVERHVLWTVPDPVGALRAWRERVPGGRLLLFEVVFPRGSVIERVRRHLVGGMTRLRGRPAEHHGSYDPELLAFLPLANKRSMEPLVGAVRAAGWTNIGVERLRDVERARREAAGLIVGRLGRMATYAVTARTD
jgi:ubiquinone/menaquinone biosynthesis C-methylase UbiE